MNDRELHQKLLEKLLTIRASSNELAQTLEKGLQELWDELDKLETEIERRFAELPPPG